MVENESTIPTAAEGTQTVVDNSAEAQLTNEVGELWHVHNQARTSLHQTREELKRIRTDLSQRLSQLKTVLSRPGRGGAWSSFLESQKIPRSTADRLVRAYGKSILGDGDNCLDEQIPEPTEVLIRRRVRALWPRLSKVLTTRDSVQVFVAELNLMAEKSFGDNALLVSSTSKITGIPSYLMGLPGIAVSNDAAHG